LAQSVFAAHEAFSVLITDIEPLVFEQHPVPQVHPVSGVPMHVQLSHAHESPQQHAAEARSAPRLARFCPHPPTSIAAPARIATRPPTTDMLDTFDIASSLPARPHAARQAEKSS
jgi:hypothetical protein